MKRATFSSVSAALTVAGAAVLAGQVQAAETEIAITAVPATATRVVITPAVTPPRPAAGEASVRAPVLIAFEAGVYKCELGRSVNVSDITSDRGSVKLQWARKDYTMLAVSTRTGALRYEDSASGLVWIVIPAKAMLLDTSKGKQLANECRL